MKHSTISSLIVVVLFFSTPALGQSESDDALKFAAIEALITAPPERALPIASKVLAGEHSIRVKERALFILSQIDAPQAHAALLDFAGNGEGSLQLEAIRMIGISGNDDSLAALKSIYTSGSSQVRGAVLEAFLIAGDPQAVLDIADAAEGRDFEEAVQTLGAMGASEQLRGLLGRPGATQALIEAYAIAGDFETLREIAMDDSNPLMQVRAIEALGMVGGDAVNDTLLDLYRSAANNSVRDAALRGMMISGHEQGVLALYRDSESAQEKKRLLEILVVMESDAVWDIIDTALDGGL